MTSVLYETNIHSLPLLARGKVRDNYLVGDDRILMVATDRLSAFDVVLPEPVPGKGQLLTQMALFWFDRLKHVVPNHLTGISPESAVSADEVPQIAGRSMLVKRLRPLPIEAVVRGYLAGSGWKEYQDSGTVCSIQLPPNLVLASKLPTPIFTPATKAAAGDHDENITFAETEQLIGKDLAATVRDIALQLYVEASEYALMKGIVIADTKFEFGIDASGQLTLMDEILTPDSSRYWDGSEIREGSPPASFDKQPIRDWLESCRVDGKMWNKRPPAPALPHEVLSATSQRYAEVFRRLMG